MKTYGTVFLKFSAARGLDCTFAKAKSHIASDEEWVTYDTTVEAMILNECADAACTHAANKYCRRRECGR